MGGIQVGRSNQAISRVTRVSTIYCALPYTFNLGMAQLAVEAGAHYCDLGGNTEIVERQRGLDARDRVASVRMFVGGLSQHPRPPLNSLAVTTLMQADGGVRGRHQPQRAQSVTSSSPPGRSRVLSPPPGL